MSRPADRIELTPAGRDALAYEAIIEEMDAELRRLRNALKAIAASPDGPAVLRHIAKQAVEGGRNG